MSDARRGLAVSPRAYRWLDRASKLAGVALIAAGLEAGGDTAVGLAFATLGVAAGLATVLIDTHSHSHSNSHSQSDSDTR